MSDPRPLALVTGASRGIGLELARQFADHGFDLVVAAEDAEITQAAEQLRGGGAQVTPVQADLATQDGVTRLYAAVTGTGRPLAAAALNAGIGHGGPFVEGDLETDLRLVALNVTCVVQLAKLLLRDMAARGEGRVLFTSSIASTQPGTFHAVYNASKSFVQSFAEALAEELEDTGVTVTSLMPGPTDTDFFRRGELEDTRIGQGPKEDPAQVARQGFEALMAGKRTVVGGSLLTKAQAVAGAVLPDRVKAAAHKVMAEPQDGS